MSDALSWLLAAEAVGLAGFPVVYFLFPSFRDRGWGFARPVGLVLISYAVWVLSYAGVLENSRSSYLIAGVVVLVPGLFFVFRRRAEVASWARREWPSIVAGELVFLAIFAAWTAYRAYDPAISGTEKPMDLLFLNASAVTRFAPPTDPWLAGQPVAYYYFGYWIFGGVSLLSGVPTYIAYNLSLALIAAMAAGGVFSLSYGLVGATGAARRTAVVCALASVVLLVLVANLTGLWELASLYHVGGDSFFKWLGIEGIKADQAGEAWRPARYWWWWVASRVINNFDSAGVGQDFTIQEFPFFSFLLGDLHPHVMSIPFVLTAVGIAADLMLRPERWGFRWLFGNPVRVILIALLIGALGFINAWDIATVAALVGAVVVIKTHRQRSSSVFRSAVEALPPLLVLFAIGLVAYAPFYFGTFSSQVEPTAPIGAARFPTRPIHFVTVWGLWIVLLAPLLLALVASPVRSYAGWAWRSAAGAATPGRPAISVSALVVIVLALIVPYFIWAGIHLEVNKGATVSDLAYRFLTVLPLGVAVLVVALAVVHRARERPADGTLFALVVAALILYLLYGVELLFIHDLFGNRMNTIFKVYYQIWIMLSAIGGVALFFWVSRSKWWSGWRGVLSRATAVVAVVLAVVSLYYPVVAAMTKSANGRPPSLDGLVHVGGGERKAIEWLRKNAAGNGAAMVEAVGGGYTEFGRISSSTGVPTILNWPGHERQWRGVDYDFGDREADVERIYVTDDVEEARRLLGKYHVGYVYIGERERRKYPSVSLDKFDQIGRRIRFDDVMIYEIEEPAAVDRSS